MEATNNAFPPTNKSRLYIKLSLQPTKIRPSTMTGDEKTSPGSFVLAIHWLWTVVLLSVATICEREVSISAPVSTDKTCTVPVEVATHTILHPPNGNHENS